MIGDGRPFLVLAASNIKESELRSFFVEIDRVGVGECVKRIKYLREIADGAPRHDGAPSSRSAYDAERLEEYAATIQKVRDLLLVEGGLTKAQASRALYSELINSGIRRSLVPTYQKIAFELWLARLCDAVSQSDVLHVASRLRNDLVHGKRSRSSWPLAEPDE